jgi:hypothetical protein
VNGLERATRRRHGGIGEAWRGFGHVSGELRLRSTTATTVSSGGEGENEEGVREGAQAGRGRGLSVQFIEKGERESQREGETVGSRRH